MNEIRAVSFAVIVFIVLHYVLTLGGNYLANNSSNFLAWLPWLNATAYFLYLLSGFVVGVLARKRFILLGLISGIVSAFMAVLVFNVGREVFGIVSTLLSGLVLGGIGGSLSLLLKRSVIKAL